MIPGALLAGSLALLGLAGMALASGGHDENQGMFLSVVGHRWYTHRSEVIITFPDHGEEWEVTVAKVMMYVCFIVSVILLCWYLYQSFAGSCGWEVVFVSAVEATYYMIDLQLGEKPPATIYGSHGATWTWLRYFEWLFTCPVLLIHLSNITGMGSEYSHRTMKLLTFDQGTILCGATAAMANPPVKIIFFIFGMVFGACTFYTAAHVYIESYHMVPKGTCRRLCIAMTWTYFVSWPMFPILFLFGPEGFGHLSMAGSHIAHAVADLLSKNSWGWLGWYLRYKCKEYVIIHGDARKKQKVSWLGTEVEVDVYVDEEEEREDDPKAEVTRKSTAAYKRRASFERIAGKLKSKGVKTRASFDQGAVEEVKKMKAQQRQDEEYGMRPVANGAAGHAMNGAMSPMMAQAMGQNQQQALMMSMSKRGMDPTPWERKSVASPVAQVASLPQRVCVVVAATDESLIRFFDMQLELLPTTVRTESVISDDGLRLALTTLAGQGQYVTMVLMAPAFAQTFPGAIEAVQGRFGVPVVLFGSNAVMRAQMGAMDNMDGPSYGAAFRQEDLIMLINKWHDSPYRPQPGRISGMQSPQPRMAAAPGGQDQELLQNLMSEIGRLRGELGKSPQASGSSYAG